MSISKRIAVTALLLVLALALACSSKDDKPGAPTPTGPVAAATTPGTPNGTATSAVIGAAGGSLSSSDGSLTLTVHADALASDATIAIQPITNTTNGGLGGAFRLGPSGLTFTVPATLTYHASAADLRKSGIHGLGIAVQDAEGYWTWVAGVSYDEGARTLTVPVEHFTDYAPAAFTLLDPVAKNVDVNETVSLKLVSCFAVVRDGENRGCRCDDYDGWGEDAVEWAVNGIVGGNSAVGTVAGGSTSAVYTAPAQAPTPSEVVVSAKLENGTTPENQNVTVLSTITIAEPGDFLGTITIEWTTMGTPFTITMNDARLTLKDDGIDETNYTLTGNVTIAPGSFMMGDVVCSLVDPATKPYADTYAFKVKKTNPPTVRWGLVQDWAYEMNGSPWGVYVLFQTGTGMGCAMIDVPVATLDNIDGTYNMSCAQPAYGGTATWDFTKLSR